MWILIYCGHRWNFGALWMVVLRILVIFLDDFAMPWWWLCEITATTNFQKIWVLAFLLFKGVTFKLSYTDFEYFHLFLLCRGGGDGVICF